MGEPQQSNGDTLRFKVEYNGPIDRRLDEKTIELMVQFGWRVETELYTVSKEKRVIIFSKVTPV